MKVLAFCLFTLIFNHSFGQSTYPIEGKWVPEGFGNTLYILADGKRYTYYCVSQNCDSIFNTYEANDGNHLPSVEDYTFNNDTLIIDLNFGNFLNSQIIFDCDGHIAQFQANNSSWIRLNTNLNDCNSSGLSNTHTELEPQIFPNPVNDKLHISFDEVQYGNMSIVSATGQKIMEFTFNDHQIDSDLSQLDVGAYLVLIHTTTGFYKAKIFKM